VWLDRTETHGRRPVRRHESRFYMAFPRRAIRPGWPVVERDVHIGMKIIGRFSIEDSATFFSCAAFPICRRVTGNPQEAPLALNKPSGRATINQHRCEACRGGQARQEELNHGSQYRRACVAGRFAGRDRASRGSCLFLQVERSGVSGVLEDHRRFTPRFSPSLR